MNSHKPVLRTIGSVLDPISVIEFGAGPHSTPLFLDRSVFPRLESLISYENHRDWARQVEEVAGYDARLHLVEIDLDFVGDVVLKCPRNVPVFLDSHTIESRIVVLAHHRFDLIVMHDAENTLYHRALVDYDHVIIYIPDDDVAATAVLSDDPIPEALVHELKRVATINGAELSMSLAEAKEFWKVASTFPKNKEDVYPEHAAAHAFDEQAGGIVLEYGCGGGSDTASLARRGARVWAVDVVPENVKETNKFIEASGLGDQVVVLLLEESAVLPVEAEAFDSVNCHGVLHHIENPLPVVCEFARVLRSGGRLYAMLYTEYYFQKCQKTVNALVGRGLTREEAFSKCSDGGGYARPYTEEEGFSLLAEGGLLKVEARLYNNSCFRTFIASKP